MKEFTFEEKSIILSALTDFLSQGERIRRVFTRDEKDSFDVELEKIRQVLNKFSNGFQEEIFEEGFKRADEL